MKWDNKTIPSFQQMNKWETLFSGLFCIFQKKNIFVSLQGRKGSKFNEFYWQHKNNKNHGDFICFRRCTTPPSWRVGGLDHSFWSQLRCEELICLPAAGTTGWTVSTWTQASCRTHSWTWKPFSQVSSPGACVVLKCFASIRLPSPSHVCVVSIAAALSACLRQVRASWRRRTGSLLTACRKCSQPTSSGTSC